MKNEELLRQWENEENLVMKGWDFSHIEKRWDCPEPPWDYKMIVKSYLKDTDILLDMGTGGGEVLLSIGHPYKNTYATEAYVPNFELCEEILSPLGIKVVQTYTDDKLPFGNECFNFIINRHESFDLSEVNNVLKRGGYFFTQQVGNQNSVEFMMNINNGLITYNPNHKIENYQNELTRLGFQVIVKDEVKYPVKFFDVGAFVFYAKACIWEFPGFSVKSHYDKLYEYQREIEKNGFILGTGHRFILAARKI